MKEKKFILYLTLIFTTIELEDFLYVKQARADNVLWNHFPLSSSIETTKIE